jgi:hypothetical protein
VAIIGLIFFGALAQHAPAVSADLAPGLRQQLAAVSLPAAAVSATVADVQTCADDRARSRDPAVTPASCDAATLQPTEPTANTTIADTLQRANARNYADAYVTAMFFNVATLLLALVCALALPTARTGEPRAKRKRKREGMPPL